MATILFHSTILSGRTVIPKPMTVLNVFRTQFQLPLLFYLTTNFQPPHNFIASGARYK